MPADFATTWQQICSRAQTDEDFKSELMANPTQVLADHDFPAPEGFKFAVVENEPTIMTLVLPARQEEIDRVAPAGDTTVSQYHASIV